MSGIMIAALIPLLIGILFCYYLKNDPMVLVYGAVIVAAFIIQPFATTFGLIIWGMGKLGG